jgi:hypothetical protein
MDESKHLASLIGVSPKQIYEIFKSGTDWEFIIKMDALLEAASKTVVKLHSRTIISTQTQMIWMSLLTLCP